MSCRVKTTLCPAASQSISFWRCNIPSVQCKCSIDPALGEKLIDGALLRKRLNIVAPAPLETRYLSSPDLIARAGCWNGDFHRLESVMVMSSASIPSEFCPRTKRLATIPAPPEDENERWSTRTILSLLRALSLRKFELSRHFDNDWRSGLSG
jgi:hypothetical protein